MKRSTKLSLKTETLRQLDNQQLAVVGGGVIVAKSSDCVLAGGSGNPQSTEDPNRYYFDAVRQIYVAR